MRIDEARHQDMVPKGLIHVVGKPLEPGPHAVQIANGKDAAIFNRNGAGDWPARIHGQNPAGCKNRHV